MFIFENNKELLIIKTKKKKFITNILKKIKKILKIINFF